MSKEKVKPEDLIDNKRKEQLTPREKVAEGFRECRCSDCATCMLCLTNLNKIVAIH